jgi:hypothetical protein
VKIDDDVLLTARRFGIDPKLIQAVVNAEGDILKAVCCSLPETPDRAKALDITCRSAVHAMSDFIKLTEHDRLAFVAFWARRWAPQGADNDPTALNQNWPRNVLKLWTKP